MIFTIPASRSSHFKTLERRFAAAGIPLFNYKAIKINDDKVTLAFDALLVIYESYCESSEPKSAAFRFAVASFLRSYICNYSDQQLYDLLSNKKHWFFERCATHENKSHRRPKGGQTEQ